MDNVFIIIRGVPCSRKSTIADKMREHFCEKKIAIIHTSIFYHSIVNGDSPAIVMENTKRIIDNYLKNKYTVVLEGTLSFKNHDGEPYINCFIKLGKKHKVKTKQFFFYCDLKEAVRREKTRKKISIMLLKKMFNTALSIRSKGEFLIDTTKKSNKKIISEILGYLG